LLGHVHQLAEGDSPVCELGAAVGSSEEADANGVGENTLNVRLGTVSGEHRLQDELVFEVVEMYGFRA
jgi:hypothetical protein